MPDFHKPGTMNEMYTKNSKSLFFGLKSLFFFGL